MHCWSQVSAAVRCLARTGVFWQFVVCWLCFRRSDSVTSKTRQWTRLSFCEQVCNVDLGPLGSVLCAACLLGLCCYALHSDAVTIDAFRVALFALRVLGRGCSVGPCCASIHASVCSLAGALCASVFACVATLSINTPMSLIVNLMLVCLLVCGVCWLCLRRACELQAWLSCALKLWGNRFSFVD